MQNFINLGKDEKQQADLFRETEASTMYPPEKNSKTSKSTLNSIDGAIFRWEIYSEIR